MPIIQHVDALNFMTAPLARPYTIFYPVISRDGMPFPENQCVREIQQGRALRGNLWRGDLVIAAYTDAYVPIFLILVLKPIDI
jgi:hypothetical protein